MAYIPPNAHWYIADIVEEFTIEDQPENLVHTNMVLIRADSPEEAFDRSMELGRASDMQYMNSDGKTVTVRFCGLRDLNVVHGELTHGTELIYSRTVGMSPEELGDWVSPKEALGVFRPGAEED